MSRAVITFTLVIGSLGGAYLTQAQEKVGVQPVLTSLVDKGGARELSKQEAAEVLGVPSKYVEYLESTKSKLSEPEFEFFQMQFGRLPNGNPTFQISKDSYFVLIPLTELDRQPPRGEGAVPPNGPAPKEGKVENPELPKLEDKTKGKIDHRERQSPVRDQGHRGTCVAFAACGELEALIAKEKRQHPKGFRLCENLAYYWFMKEEQSTPCKDPGLATFRAAGYLKKHLVCEETHWEYVPTSPSDLMGKGKCPDIDKPPAIVNNKPGYGVDKYVHLPAGSEVDPNGTVDMKDTLTLERLLDAGHPVVFGTVVAWTNKQAQSGVIDVTRGPAGQPIFGAGGHAMMIVGYQSVNPENKTPYFIVKNSWGTNYGEKGYGGYLRLSYDYIRTYARYGYVTTKLREGKVAL